MKKIKQTLIGLSLLAVFVGRGFCQNALQFTGVNATPEKAMQLHWASNTNEVYEIDYADQLAGNDDGSTAWFPLYQDYPSHGTNTFWLDTGNYNLDPAIQHPKNSPMRFYRIALQGTNTGSNPTITITSPTNGTVVSSNITVTVSASSDQILDRVALYVDGQEMWPSDNGSNFVINTCEWWNGQHTLFAVAKSASHFPGKPGDTSVTYGHAVSSYVNVTFDNLISEVAFSEPYFEPSLGQTQKVTASFAANVNWTLQIQNVNSNTVRNASGSGISMEFDWDGKGDGDTNIPDGVYIYLISAQTNGQAFSMMSGGGGSFSSSASAVSAASEEVMELWALSPESSGPPLPLAIYPPGFNTNGFEIFEASQSEVQALTKAVMSVDKPVTMAKSAMLMNSENGGGSANAMDAATPSGQATSTPIRPPTITGKGTIGTFLVGYQTYFNAPFATFSTPPIPTGNPFVNKWVQLDGEANQSQAAQSQTWPANIFENTDIGDGFATTMKKGRWKGSVNPTITATDVKSSSHGGNNFFNQANVGLLVVHGSYGSTAESDGVKRSYLRFFDWKSRSPSFCKLDDCSFGGSGTNGLKWMGILACNVLNNSPYNSLYIYGRLPINDDLHLLLSASTVATFAPKIGAMWATNMLGGATVAQSWFNAGSTAYLEETNHPLTMVFRVAYWPDAINDHITDTDTSPGTGNPLDIEKQDSTVYSKP
jgi:hypothetical protein